MARLKYHPMLRELRGKSEEYVYKQRLGVPYLARVPNKSRTEPTQAQRDVRNKFVRAVRYAKELLLDPQASAPYLEAAAGKVQTPFNLIFRDFFKPPVVDSVDLSAYQGNVGDPVVISAFDDFEVTSVTVKITDANDAELESGAALSVAGSPGMWQYITSTGGHDPATVKVVATATDRPGNKTSLTATKQ